MELKFITIKHCGFSEIYVNFQLGYKIDLNISDVIDSVGLISMDLKLELDVEREREGENEKERSGYSVCCDVLSHFNALYFKFCSTK